MKEVDLSETLTTNPVGNTKEENKKIAKRKKAENQLYTSQNKIKNKAQTLAKTLVTEIDCLRAINSDLEKEDKEWWTEKTKDIMDFKMSFQDIWSLLLDKYTIIDTSKTD